MAMETLRKVEPMQNVNHDLIQMLSTKLDSAVRYAIYKKDAHEDKADHEVISVLEQLEHDDMRHVQLLRDAIAHQVRTGKWV